MSGRSFLDALEPGDATTLPSLTVEFHGQTFHVLAYVGDQSTAWMRISADGDTAKRDDAADSATLISSLLRAAANLLVIGLDWSKTDPQRACEIAALDFANQFFTVLDQHKQAMAQRGRPS